MQAAIGERSGWSLRPLALRLAQHGAGRENDSGLMLRSTVIAPINAHTELLDVGLPRLKPRFTPSGATQNVPAAAT